MVREPYRFRLIEGGVVHPSVVGPGDLWTPVAKGRQRPPFCDVAFSGKATCQNDELRPSVPGGLLRRPCGVLAGGRSNYKDTPFLPACYDKGFADRLFDIIVKGGKRLATWTHERLAQAMPPPWPPGSPRPLTDAARYPRPPSAFSQPSPIMPRSSRGCSRPAARRRISNVRPARRSCSPMHGPTALCPGASGGLCLTSKASGGQMGNLGECSLPACPSQPALRSQSSVQGVCDSPHPHCQPVVATAFPAWGRPRPRRLNARRPAPPPR
jgi:hypothetical protein